MAAFIPPSGYDRIKVVQSFPELVATPFADGVNALCWARTLLGDFEEIVSQLTVDEGITNLDDAALNHVSLSAAGRVAREILLADQQLLRAHGLAPSLDCIDRYPRDEETAPIATDVYSFHADSAPVVAETYLCSYCGAATEGLRNDEAQRRVDLPAIRAELLQRCPQEKRSDFAEYLRENCYDLHYAALPGARPFSFGLGNLWRIAIDFPGSPVPPCLHRAPDTRPGQPPRLLLIS